MNTKTFLITVLAIYSHSCKAQIPDHALSIDVGGMHQVHAKITNLPNMQFSCRTYNLYRKKFTIDTTAVVEPGPPYGDWFTFTVYKNGIEQKHLHGVSLDNFELPSSKNFITLKNKESFTYTVNPFLFLRIYNKGIYKIRWNFKIYVNEKFHTLHSNFITVFAE